MSNTLHTNTIFAMDEMLKKKYLKPSLPVGALLWGSLHLRYHYILKFTTYNTQHSLQHTCRIWDIDITIFHLPCLQGLPSHRQLLAFPTGYKNSFNDFRILVTLWYVKRWLYGDFRSFNKIIDSNFINVSLVLALQKLIVDTYLY